MEKASPSFENFLFDVSPMQLPFVEAMHTYLLANGCTVKVELAKSGYVISYVHAASKRTLANYVFRKKGLLIRIYGENVAGYEPYLAELPETMRKAIIKAPVCRRLLDETKCNKRCPMGNVFTLDGTLHKKCRYTTFMFLIEEESNPFIRSLVEKELAARSA